MPVATDSVADAVAAAVAASVARAPAKRVVLAVSGGRDSMVMLHAMIRAAPQAIAAVATFDHRTGQHASDAVKLVAATCAASGIPVRVGSAERATKASEATWRADRWRFLRAVAAEERATVATAHTRDDNIETVLLRELRGSGARGLAALYATGDVARPLIDVSREAVARYAATESVRWVEDPSNQSLVYRRNRVRHEILPALLGVRPALADELLDIARRAAELRSALEGTARTLASLGKDGSLGVAAAPLADYDPEGLRTLWPAIAAQGDIVLDARGTAGLARFTKCSKTGDRMQLSGGVEVLRRRDEIVLGAKSSAHPKAARLGTSLTWGSWRFAAHGAAIDDLAGDAWSASLPTASTLIVRGWRDGDRMHGAGDAAPRRVKRFLRDAGLAGPERSGWPVVVCGDEVVWIPGVRRSNAAAVRSGRPEAVYVCERTEA
ncbi:MAG: tRNA lysidine(34) synthetase TilS [Gemmatimonadaceae bacterium]